MFSVISYLKLRNDIVLYGWGRPTPTLVPWRQGFRLQQGTSVSVGLPKPFSTVHLIYFTNHGRIGCLHTIGNQHLYLVKKYINSRMI